MNKHQIAALQSYTEAKSRKYEQMINGLISEAEFASWEQVNKAELDNALAMLESKPENWLDKMSK